MWTNYLKPFLAARETHIDASIENGKQYVLLQAKSLKQKALHTAQTRFAMFITQVWSI
jgi:hypothetical protein